MNDNRLVKKEHQAKKMFDFCRLVAWLIDKVAVYLLNNCLLLLEFLFLNQNSDVNF